MDGRTAERRVEDREGKSCWKRTGEESRKEKGMAKSKNSSKESKMEPFRQDSVSHALVSASAGKMIRKKQKYRDFPEVGYGGV